MITSMFHENFSSESVASPTTNNPIGKLNPSSSTDAIPRSATESNNNSTTTIINSQSDKGPPILVPRKPVRASSGDSNVSSNSSSDSIYTRPRSSTVGSDPVSDQVQHQLHQSHAYKLHQAIKHSPHISNVTAQSFHKLHSSARSSPHPSARSSPHPASSHPTPNPSPHPSSNPSPHPSSHSLSPPSYDQQKPSSAKQFLHYHKNSMHNPLFPSLSRPKLHHHHQQQQQQQQQQQPPRTPSPDVILPAQAPSLALNTVAASISTDMAKAGYPVYSVRRKPVGSSSSLGSIQSRRSVGSPTDVMGAGSSPSSSKASKTSPIASSSPSKVRVPSPTPPEHVELVRSSARARSNSPTKRHERSKSPLKKSPLIPNEGSPDLARESSPTYTHQHSSAQLSSDSPTSIGRTSPRFTRETSPQNNAPTPRILNRSTSNDDEFTFLQSPSQRASSDPQVRKQPPTLEPSIDISANYSYIPAVQNEKSPPRKPIGSTPDNLPYRRVHTPPERSTLAPPPVQLTTARSSPQLKPTSNPTASPRKYPPNASPHTSPTKQPPQSLPPQQPPHTSKRPMSLQFMNFSKQKIDPDDDDEYEESDSFATSSKHWKYHILKYSKDLYLTTNPDPQHITMRVGPSYYIDITSFPHGEFNLNFNENGKLSFSVVRKKGDGISTSDCYSITLQSGFHTPATYIANDASELLYSPSNNKGVRCEQYLFKLDNQEWLVGNKQHLSKGDLVKVSKTKVYFSLKTDPTLILGMVRRRIPIKKRVLQLGKKNIDKEEDDDADEEKIGWLYAYDVALESPYPPWMMKVVVGLTMAVAYGQRLDSKKTFRASLNLEKKGKIAK